MAAARDPSKERTRVAVDDNAPFADLGHGRARSTL